MKKGTRVEFTTKSGKVIEGILEETMEKRAVVKSGNRTYKPPIELVRKAKKKPAKKETPKPKTEVKTSSVREARKRDFVTIYADDDIYLAQVNSKNAHTLDSDKKEDKDGKGMYYKVVGVKDTYVSRNDFDKGIKSFKFGGSSSSKRGKLMTNNGKDIDSSQVKQLETQTKKIEKDHPVLEKARQEALKKEGKTKASVVEIKLGDKKSEKQGRVKLSKSLLDRAEKNLDILLKDYTFAKAKKILMKDKVEFVKFLDKSNELAEPINDMVQVLNKAIQEDDITEAEARAFGNKMKRSNTARKKIMKLLQDSFDSQKEFEDTLKKAGIKTLKR